MNKITKLTQLLTLAQCALDATLRETQRAVDARDAAIDARDKAAAQLASAKESVKTWFTAESLEIGPDSTLALAAWAVWSSPMTEETRQDAFRALGIESSISAETERQPLTHLAFPASWRVYACVSGGYSRELGIRGGVRHEIAP